MYLADPALQKGKLEENTKVRKTIAVKAQASSTVSGEHCQTRKGELLKYDMNKWNELMNCKSEVFLVITLIFEGKILVSVEKAWENQSFYSGCNFRM